MAVGPLVLAQGQTASRWQRPDWTSSFNSKTQLCYFTTQTGGPGAIYSPQMWFFIDIWPAQFHKFKAAYNSSSESSYENSYCSNSKHPFPQVPAGGGLLAVPGGGACAARSAQPYGSRDGCTCSPPMPPVGLRGAFL